MGAFADLLQRGSPHGRISHQWLYHGEVAITGGALRPGVSGCN